MKPVSETQKQAFLFSGNQRADSRKEVVQMGAVRAIFAAATTMLMFLCSPVLAAELVYNPGYASVEAEPGTASRVGLSVSALGTERDSYLVSFVDSVSGTIPREWISAAPSTGYIFGPGSYAATALSVVAPPGTPSGRYYGYVHSKATGRSGEVNPGKGLYLELSVTGCADVPQISIDSFSPTVIWPPRNQMVFISFSGRVSLPAGCSMTDTVYAVSDEYDQFSARVPFRTSADGSFTGTVPVAASRSGSDTDGRRYSITVYASDEAGMGTAGPLVSVVPHDNRK
jgi:hypothetical protein